MGWLSWEEVWHNAHTKRSKPTTNMMKNGQYDETQFRHPITILGCQESLAMCQKLPLPPPLVHIQPTKQSRKPGPSWLNYLSIKTVRRNLETCQTTTTISIWGGTLPRCASYFSRAMATGHHLHEVKQQQETYKGRLPWRQQTLDIKRQRVYEKNKQAKSKKSVVSWVVAVQLFLSMTWELMNKQNRVNSWWLNSLFKLSKS